MEPDRNGNYLPSKGKSSDSIDGIAATLDALVPAFDDLLESESIYETLSEVNF